MQLGDVQVSVARISQLVHVRFLLLRALVVLVLEKEKAGYFIFSTTCQCNLGNGQDDLGFCKSEKS